jgi:DNA-binding MarR family transcriptional regulator
MSDASIDRDSEELFGLLFGVVLEGEKRMAEHLSANGLTAPQFYVLKTLTENNGRLGIGEIARRHGLTNATMTGLIKRMEQFEPPLVMRAEDKQDRRAVVVTLTEEGMARFEAVQRSFMHQLQAVFRLIPETERRRLLDQLQQYMMLVQAAGLLNGASSS